ncbi:MAG: hypothetical protein WD021_07070 [Rhodothermales bacterium]
MSTYKRILSAVLVFGFIGLVAACDNPVEDELDDDHAEVEGVALMVGGEEVVRVLEGEVTGELEIAADGGSVEIDVEFLDHDGDRIHAEDLDEDFSLGWEIADESVVTASQTGDWSFSLTPGAAGVTDLSVQLMHGGHADFTTPDIHVHVE